MQLCIIIIKKHMNQFQKINFVIMGAVSLPNIKERAANILVSLLVINALLSEKGNQIVSKNNGEMTMALVLKQLKSYLKSWWYLMMTPASKT